MSTEVTREEKNNLVEFFRILHEWDRQNKAAINKRKLGVSDQGVPTREAPSESRRSTTGPQSDQKNPSK